MSEKDETGSHDPQEGKEILHPNGKILTMMQYEVLVLVKPVALDTMLDTQILLTQALMDLNDIYLINEDKEPSKWLLVSVR